MYVQKQLTLHVCRCCCRGQLVQHVNDVAAVDRKRMNVNPLGVLLRCVARMHHCAYSEFTNMFPSYTTAYFVFCEASGSEDKYDTF